jgi:hypothetical protein
MKWFESVYRPKSKTKKKGKEKKEANLTGLI